MLVTKRIDLELLGRELATADVVVTGLGLSGFLPETPTEQELYQVDGDGAPLELPPAAVPVVEAHTAPPLVTEFAARVTVDAVTRTTDDVPTEVFRFPTAPKQVYRATFQMTAIDAGSGATKDSEARMTFKRMATAVSQVGTTTVISNAQDAAAASWAIQPSIQGTDLVISVRGATGRTVDWLLVGGIAVYAPERLA